jgi:hypothetical protein
MSTEDAVPDPPDLPVAVRRLETGTAGSLAHLAEVFEDLQTVLRCCEQLVTALRVPAPDPALVEALWTTALLSYARCFAEGALTEADVLAVQPGEEVLAWHRLVLRLRDHYADPVTNPRERFAVGVAQDSSGGADGLALTSTRQPLVDEVTVRQTGAVGYALSGLVDARMTEGQATLFDEVRGVSADELEALVRVELSPAAPQP